MPISDTDTRSTIPIEKPHPGVFIFRLSDGLSYPNVTQYFHTLVQDIVKSTRSTNQQQRSTKKGDRPWNDPKPGRKAIQGESSQLPLLRAVILDFSAVSHVDVTSVQGLIDVRNQLSRHAAPVEVQWHFASIQNRWTRRALTAAGFGYPSSIEPSVINGQDADPEKLEKDAAPRDIETGEEAESSKEKGQQESEAENRPCHGTAPQLGGSARPFFHIDLTSALESVDAYLLENPVS